MNHYKSPINCSIRYKIVWNSSLNRCDSLLFTTITSRRAIKDLISFTVAQTYATTLRINLGIDIRGCIDSQRHIGSKRRIKSLHIDALYRLLQRWLLRCHPSNCVPVLLCKEGQSLHETLDRSE